MIFHKEKVFEFHENSENNIGDEEELDIIELIDKQLSSLSYEDIESIWNFRYNEHTKK